MSATTASPPPTALAIHADGIPQELKSLAQWVAWRWEWRAGRDGEPGKWTKPPISPVTGKYASATDAGTWASFDDAIAFARSRRLPGVGLAVTREDGYVGTDIDKCRDPETGEITAWAQAIIDRFNPTYVEPSPSGTGVRMFIRTDTGLLPNGEDGRRKGPVEIYGAGRYFTVTGHRLNGTGEITERTEELAAFCAELWPATTQEPATFRVGSTSLSDDEIIDRARSATNGAKFMRLFAGDTSEHGGDDSAADLALLGILAFWTQDPDQLDRLFRRSGLYRPKWDRADYRERTIGKALAGGEVYMPGRNGATPQADQFAADESFAPAPPVPSPAPPRPVLDPAALHGLAGDVVRTIAPHTEADDVAVLDSFLLMFGNAMGRTPYVRVGATRHHANEYAVLVGDTSHTRKGTSLQEARRLMEVADAGWVPRMMGGLSSGEGLIHAVRDATTKIAKDGTEVPDDPGVSDKRLLAIESEFASVLRVASRDGNTLSELLRRGWDGDDLRTLTRNSPLCATRPHVSLLGHITKKELLRELTETSQANGWANRHLFACVRRSKLLPHGGALSDIEAAALGEQVKVALQSARVRGELRRDEEANRMWEAVYPALTADRPGMFGSITARAEAHVLRLSLLYALLDNAPTIQRPHLEAALALWQYCEDSARFIFGDATGDPVADAILTALRSNGKMTQTQISELFGKNQKGGRIQQALTALLTASLVHTWQGESANGRPPTFWEAVS